MGIYGDSARRLIEYQDSLNISNSFNNDLLIFEKVEIVNEISLSDIIDKIKELIAKFIEWLAELKDKFLDQITKIFEDVIIKKINKIKELKSNNENGLLEASSSNNIPANLKSFDIPIIDLSGFLDSKKADYVYESIKLGKLVSMDSPKSNISNPAVDKSSLGVTSNDVISRETTKTLFTNSEVYQRSILNDKYISLMGSKDIKEFKSILKNDPSVFRIMTKYSADKDFDFETELRACFSNNNKILKDCANKLTSESRKLNNAINSNTKFGDNKANCDHETHNYKLINQIIKANSKILSVARELYREYVISLNRTLLDLIKEWYKEK